MTQIDATLWQEFQLGEIFKMKNTKSIPATIVTPDSGDVPYVTAKQGNNGVQTYINCPNEWLEEGQCILIGGKTLTFSFQEVDFCSNDSHNIALYIKKAPVTSHFVHLFLIAVLRAKFSQVFSWSDSISMRRAKDLSVELPVDANGQPDWDYMQSVMELQVPEAEKRLESLLAISSTPPRSIDTSLWHEFRLDELFTLVKGSRLKSTDRVPGPIPYVGASSFNNGITHYISNNECIHPGGVLTVCYNGPVGTTFYQPTQFWATDDVNVLYPKAHMPMEVLLFIAPMIEKIGANYAYTDKWKIDDMAASKIRLPVTASKDPDFDYIKSRMGDLLLRQESSLDVLQAIFHPSLGESEPL